MKKKLLILILFFHFTLACNYLSANVLNVPGSYATIQAALNVATTGDTVLVQPGTYFENIIWPATQSIRLISAGNSSNTTIDGGGVGTVISCYHQNTPLDSTTVIRGFRITNGQAGDTTVSSAYGGGIYLGWASPVMEELIINQNYVRSTNLSGGGGVFCFSSSPIIRNCKVSNNYVYGKRSYGGGIYCKYNSNLRIYNVEISSNYLFCIGHYWTAGAGLYCETYSNPTLEKVSVISNVIASGAGWYYGAGVHLALSTGANFINVLIANNRFGQGFNSFYYGAGMELYSCSNILLKNVTITDNHLPYDFFSSGSGLSSYNTQVTLENCILWNDTNAVEIWYDTIAPSISYSDIRGGWSGTGNIDTIPGFVNVNANDYHLLLSSPCLNAGTTASVPPDDLDGNTRPMPAGTNPDMGAYEMNQPIGISKFENNNSVVSLFPNPFTT
ncbi:MAG: hypothetical protein JJE25_03430, partial [Bacteroidia bacterium]|nr:hypothetical protein [Bacteroidia bacterium]